MKQAFPARFVTPRFLLAYVLMLAFLAGLAFGQTTGAGTITGTLTDASGAAVPDASVVIRNTSTGAERKIASSAAGVYNAQFMQPGSYEITATKAGFAKVLRTGLRLEVGQTLGIDLTLPVQSTTETVTVTGEAPIVDTDKTEMSQVVSQGLKENLPLAGRRWESFALLTPNVTTDGGTGLVSYRGISGLYNQSAVDGTSNSQAFFSETKGRTTIAYIYSMDSIQEFQAASSNYSAELGQAAGGVVNAVTKSGTNAFHGDLFYFLRYPSLNALDPLNKARGVYTQAIHQQQQFGGSIGGPIIKDKLFFFGTYDGSRRVIPIAYTSAQFLGPQSCAFSAPTTTGGATPSPLPSSICAAANAFVAGQLGAFPRSFNQDTGFGKLDYQVNNANHLATSLDIVDFVGPNGYRTLPTQQNEGPSANGNAVTHERIFVANWDSTLRPNMINNFRFQWSRDLETISANGTAPSVGITNFMTYGMPNALPRPAFPDEHRYQFADVVSLTEGKHTFKAGIDVSAIHEVLINLFQGGGVYTYSGADNFSKWAADVSGVDLGDGLTGRHFTTFVQVNDPVTGVGKDDFYNNDIAAFFEDSWKVRPNLTLNLGVRYDLQLIPQPSKPNTFTPLTTLYTSTINIDKNNFAPRLGVAWNLAKGTVLRAGYGMFYANTSNSTYYATRVENGVIQQTFNCSPTTCPALAFPNVIFTPPGGKPSAPFNGALTPQVVAFTPPGGTQTARGQTPDWVNPLVHEGEVTVERALPGNMSISGSYVFSRALRLPMFYDSNIAPSTTTRTYTVQAGAHNDAATFTVPLYTSRIDTQTGPVLTGVSDVNSWYNSLVVTLKRRMSHGFEFVANYTLSKATDGGQVAGQFGTFNGTDSPVDPYNRKLEYALSDLDQRNRFTLSAVYAPDYAKRISNKALRLIASDFVFSAIVSAGSGQPVTGTISGNATGGIAGGVTGGTVNNSGTAFGGRDPALPRNAYVSPSTKDIDLRIGRDFRFTERIRFSLVGEAFNLFNFTNIYTVNTQQFTLSGTTLIPNATFLGPATTNNNLNGARQLQLSARLVF